MFIEIQKTIIPICTYNREHTRFIKRSNLLLKHIFLNSTEYPKYDQYDNLFLTILLIVLTTCVIIIGNINGFNEQSNFVYIKSITNTTEVDVLL